MFAVAKLDDTNKKVCNLSVRKTTVGAEFSKQTFSQTSLHS